MLNAYGPTEASDVVNHYVVEFSNKNDMIIPIGRPVQNTHIFILTENLNICPIGLPGEIWCSGIGWWEWAIGKMKRKPTGHLFKSFF